MTQKYPRSANKLLRQPREMGADGGDFGLWSALGSHTDLEPSLHMDAILTVVVIDKASDIKW